MDLSKLKSKALEVYTDKGTALSADRIFYSSFIHKGPTLGQGSGNHRRKTGTLKKDAFCIIDMEFTNTNKGFK